MRFLFLGMPASGKTTFLSALTYLLTSARQTTKLRFSGLAEQEGHTSALEETWLSCVPVNRTKLQSRDQGVLRVAFADTPDNVSELEVPDLSGEAFRAPAARDICRPGLFKDLVESDGLVLFTNADRPPDDRLLFDAAPQYEALEEAFAAELIAEGQQPLPVEVDPPAEDLEGARSGTPFDPDEMPEEVLLVELLQQLNRRPFAPRKRAIAIVVSAWDVVTKDVSPVDWLQGARPMLAEYILNNDHLWEMNVWGVSAQGGKLPDDASRLRNLTEPAERITVVGEVDNPHDLSAPISWLMRRPPRAQ